MKKVTFDIPVTFYIKESNHHRSARQSDWLQKRADEQRFKDRVKAIGRLLLPIFKHGKDYK